MEEQTDAKTIRSRDLRVPKKTNETSLSNWIKKSAEWRVESWMQISLTQHNSVAGAFCVRAKHARYFAHTDVRTLNIEFEELRPVEANWVGLGR